MDKYRSRKIVDAEQYTKDSKIDCVIIGKTSNTGHWSDRFDDTPDGPYIQSLSYKLKINEGDWVIYHKDGDKSVLTDKQFKKNYELLS